MSSVAIFEPPLNSEDWRVGSKRHGSSCGTTGASDRPRRKSTTTSGTSSLRTLHDRDRAAEERSRARSVL